MLLHTQKKAIKCYINHEVRCIVTLGSPPPTNTKYVSAGPAGSHCRCGHRTVKLEQMCNILNPLYIDLLNKDTYVYSTSRKTFSLEKRNDEHEQYYYIEHSRMQSPANCSTYTASAIATFHALTVVYIHTYTYIYKLYVCIYILHRCLHLHT